MAPTVVRFTTAIIANLLLAATAATAKAQTQTLFRADDGTAYQVLRTIPPLGSGSTHVTFTSIGGSATGAGSCLGPGSVDGDLVSAVGGANPADFEALHPYNQIVRTAILVPNDITTLTFDEQLGRARLAGYIQRGLHRRGRSASVLHRRRHRYLSGTGRLQERV